MSTNLYPEIETVIQKLDPENLTAERKEILEPLIGYIQQKRTTSEPIYLNFICTHNSRRSHLSQVWAQTLAAHFEVPNVYCYSGGTEATALFPKVAQTLEELGFKVGTLSEGPNPVYSIKFSSNAFPVIGFSKTYDDPFNPESDYAAIMTCSEADEGCPFIPGAEIRVPVTYEDPKAFDNTPEQDQRYRERSLQIATELLHVFSSIKA